jgi:hypothetical protein
VNAPCLSFAIFWIATKPIWFAATKPIAYPERDVTRRHSSRSNLHSHLYPSLRRAGTSSTPIGATLSVVPRPRIASCVPDTVRRSASSYRTPNTISTPMRTRLLRIGVHIGRTNFLRTFMNALPRK